MCHESDVVYQHEFAPEYSDCETLEAGSDPHVRRVIVWDLAGMSNYNSDFVFFVKVLYIGIYIGYDPEFQDKEQRREGKQAALFLHSQ